MRAERIILRNAAPVGVHHLFALRFFANAVLPVVFVGEAAARPAQQRHFYVLESLYNVAAYAAHVWYRRVFADVDAIVDASAEVLGKVSVYLGGDVRAHVGGVYQHGKFLHIKLPFLY